MTSLDEIRSEFFTERTKESLDNIDRALWPLMRLGVGTYGEFSWDEGIEALRAQNCKDPAGHLFRFLDRDYIYRDRPIVRAKDGGAFSSERERNERDGLVMVFHVSALGEIIADLVWPGDETRSATTFGYHDH